MTLQIVIHAGFHKTGTSSVQAMLRENGPLLEPHLQVLLKDDFKDLTIKAREFSITPDQGSLRQVIHAAITVFEAIDPNDPRPILMASEDLSGHMPGRLGLKSYDSAGLIMKCLSEAAFAQFGADTDLTFYFSTRESDPWLRSTWWQNLRSTRLISDFADYRSQFENTQNLTDILEEIETDVAPAKVVSCLLERSTELPLGPLEPVLDCLSLPELDKSSLKALPPENVQPDVGIDAVFLALNQSKLSDKDVQKTKRSIRKMARHDPK